jgi:hypothetical protein
MFWYIKKEEFFHSELLGPYDTREQAELNCPRDKNQGRLESHEQYRIFESEDLL